MQRLDLDFARPPGPRGPWPHWLAGLGAGALAAALWHAAHLDRQVQEVSAALEAAGQGARRTAAAPTPAAAADEATRQELARAGQVVAALGLGWGPLFRQLETVRVPGVVLSGVQRESSGLRRLRVRGEAGQMEQALAYVARIAAAPGFANVHLVSHEFAGDAERPATLRFTILADWMPPP